MKKLWKYVKQKISNDNFFWYWKGKEPKINKTLQTKEGVRPKTRQCLGCESETTFAPYESLCKKKKEPCESYPSYLKIKIFNGWDVSRVTG